MADIKKHIEILKETINNTNLQGDKTMTRECPSCGNSVESGQAFCPMCGTKMNDVGKPRHKAVNQELESLLFTANSNAEVALASKLGAGLGGQKNYQRLLEMENIYLEIISKFPVEPIVYTSYVDYMIKFVLKINSLTNVFATTQYFIGDLNAIITRCKNYLLKAKEFADDSELETILQLESVLSSKIESIAKDDTIKLKEEKNKKIAKWCWIGLGVFFGVLFIIYLIVDSLGI